MQDQPFQIIRGACGHDCPDTCSWMVEVRNGRAEKLYGDPEHPFTRGTLCAKVNHYLERVYHPDRVLFPLKRIGRKGEERFARVTWKEALDEIAARWQAIIKESGPEAILPYSFAGNQGLIQYASLDRRLFGMLGVSQLTRALCGEVATAGLAATQGSGLGINPEDIVHSRFIVLWATNTIVTNLHLWPLIREARERGARVVVIDPVRTRTADAADWHIAPAPGTDAALALGMMHIIIRDGLVDTDYVTQHAVGFDQLAERANQYPPEHAAKITGVPAAEIERFAREYATTQPSLIRPLIGLEHHRNGAMMFRTIACLPILTGAWRHRGGGLARSTGAFQFSTLDIDALLMPQLQRPARELNMRDLGSDLCNPDLAPPIRSLIVYNSNPAVIAPSQNRVIEGLQREDLFTVVHDLFVTDTARYADFVLPATSQIEHLDLVPAWGHLYLSLNKPAIAPQGEAIANTELFRRLAQALGFTKPWLFDSDEKLLKTALASGHPYLEDITWEHLWGHGYAKLKLPKDWRPFANGGFPTSSGKAELFSATLREQGHDPLPEHKDDRPPASNQLRLLTSKSLHYLNTSYSQIDRHVKRSGQLFIEIHPQDASNRSLVNGQPVRISNEYGELTAECRVSNRVSQGVAWMPHGWLRDLQGERRSINALTSTAPTDWGGGSAYCDAYVAVSALTPA